MASKVIHYAGDIWVGDLISDMRAGPASRTAWMVDHLVSTLSTSGSGDIVGASELAEWIVEMIEESHQLGLDGAGL